MSEDDHSQRSPKAYNQILDALFYKQLALDAIDDGIVITDIEEPDNPIVYCNYAFQLLTGYPEEEIVGHNCRFLQGKDTDPQTIEEMRTCIKQGQKFSGEILNYHKDRTPFWNQLTISPIFNEFGTLIYFVGIQRDVTHIVNMRQELQNKAQENEAFKAEIHKLMNRVREQETILQKYGKNGKE